MLGAILGAVGGLASSFFGAKSAEKNAAKQAALQKEFAQNAIQWKARDAEKAGISKLYALGANTTSYAPVSVGDTSGLGNLGSMGQDIGRALDMARPSGGKAETVLATEAAKAQITGLNLDNEIKRVQLASDIQKTQTTGMPGASPALGGTLRNTVIEGQGNAAPTAIKMQKQMSPSDPGEQANEAGLSPEVSWYRTKTGWAPMVPQQLGEALESQLLGAYQWQYRNQIAPAFNNNYFNPPFPAPKGKIWKFDPTVGVYELHSIGGPRPFVPSWLGDNKG